jgi:REP element-mobilizing transposase RayT
VDDKKELPKRKELRLKQFDYSSAGAYFITVCVKDRKRILSKIQSPVGVGAHDDPYEGVTGRPKIQLTKTGEIIEKYLLSSKKIPGVKIDRYVIMPDHIHAIVLIYPGGSSPQKNGSSRAPTPTNETLPHIVSTFKRLCGKELGRSIFQRGYFEHVIRGREDYETTTKYIIDNPIRWYYDGPDAEVPLPASVTADKKDQNSI